MNQEVTIYQKTRNGKEHFNEAKPSLFLHPTVLCCGGASCTHGKRENANGFCKKADALLNTMSESWLTKPFNIASVTYADSVVNEATIHTLNRDQQAVLFSDFVDTYFTPLFADEDGKRLNIQTAAKNFRNLQVLAHSFGGLFIQQVDNVLVERMKAHGYKDHEIPAITQQVLVVASGSAAAMGKGKANFTVVNILHARDAKVPICNWNINATSSLLDEEAKKQSLTFIPYRFNAVERSFEKDSSARQATLFINASALDAVTPLRYQDSRENGHEVLPEEITDTSFHEPPTYYDYTLSRSGMMLRTAAACALYHGLNNAIFNDSALLFEPLPRPAILLEAPIERQNQSHFGYNERKGFCHVMRAIGYNQRMQAAINGDNEFPVLSETTR